MNIAGIEIPEIILEALALIISTVIPIIGFIFLGTKQRIVFVLKLRGIQFFKTEFFTETRNRYHKVVLLSECKKLGRFYQFVHKSQRYLVNPKAIFQSSGSPTIQFDEGNAIPRMPFASESENIDATEVNEIANSKIVHDLLKFTFSRLELVYLIIACVGIAINIAVLYFTYTTNQNYATLVSQLNGILRQMQSQT